MNENNSPLNTPPKAQQFQVMVVLSAMWTTCVFLGLGSWYRWGDLVDFHVGVAVSILITNLTFAQAGSRGHYCPSNSELGLPENYPLKRTAGAG
mgnify:CR=1 FL=1